MYLVPFKVVGKGPHSAVPCSLSAPFCHLVCISGGRGSPADETALLSGPQPWEHGRSGERAARLQSVASCTSTHLQQSTLLEAWGCLGVVKVSGVTTVPRGTSAGIAGVVDTGAGCWMGKGRAFTSSHSGDLTAHSHCSQRALVCHSMSFRNHCSSG